MADPFAVALNLPPRDLAALYECLDEAIATGRPYPEFRERFARLAASMKSRSSMCQQEGWGQPIRRRFEEQ